MLKSIRSYVSSNSLPSFSIIVLLSTSLLIPLLLPFSLITPPSEEASRALENSWHELSSSTQAVDAWFHVIGNSTNEQANDIDLYGGKIYIAGQWPPFIACLDLDGRLEWYRTIGDDGSISQLYS